MTLPHERRRALDALPGVATLILDAAARAMRQPGVAYARIPADLIRALGGALRHYPMRSEVDCYWREDEGAEIAALREEVERLRWESARRGARVARLAECVREAHDMLSVQVEEMRPFVPGGYREWLAQPEVKLAIEEEL